MAGELSETFYNAFLQKLRAAHNKPELIKGAERAKKIKSKRGDGNECERLCVYELLGRKRPKKKKYFRSTINICAQQVQLVYLVYAIQSNYKNRKKNYMTLLFADRQFIFALIIYGLTILFIIFPHSFDLSTSFSVLLVGWQSYVWHLDGTQLANTPHTYSLFFVRVTYWLMCMPDFILLLVQMK